MQRFLQRRFFIYAPRSVRGIPHPLRMLLIRPLNASHIHARRPRRPPRAHSGGRRPAHVPPSPTYARRAHASRPRRTPVAHARELDAPLALVGPRLLDTPLGASMSHLPTPYASSAPPNVALPCYPNRSHSPLAERLNCQPPTSPPRVADLRTRRRCQLDAPLPRHLRCKPDTALAIPRARLPPRLPATRPAASMGLTLSLLRTHICAIYHALRHHPLLPLFISLLLSLLHILSCLKIFMFL
ncbi:hypothetical protein K438DRAFT_1870447 [Mycena galopus ATCC 62051]|nr:hypothetical protein K438DRAFT_1870447 [Mycena galopus ATCC 62051]